MDFIKKPTLIVMLSIILFVSLIGAGYYYSRKNVVKPARPDSISVEVEMARKGSLTNKMKVPGTLQADHFVTMRAQVKGLVSKVHVVGGENVQEGDLLFEIDDRLYRALLKDAKASLTLHESAFQREKKLSEKHFGTAKKLEEARAQFLKAQANVEKAQKELDDTRISAPFDGVVGLHKISTGTPITGDLDLISITDLDPMKVNFKLPAKFVSFINVGQRITVEVNSYPGRKFKGRIEAIDARIDSSAQSIAVQATIPNRKNILKPGMYALVEVVVGSKNNTLIVPEEAVVAVGNQTYVWKVIEHPEHPGKYVAFRVQVLTGIHEKESMEITRNLGENDIVITVGHQRAADGIPVSFDLQSIGLGPKEEEKKDTPTVEKKEEGQKKAIKETKASSSLLALNAKFKSLWLRIKSFFSNIKSEPKLEKKSEPKLEKKSEPKLEKKSEQPVSPSKNKKEVSPKVDPTSNLNENKVKIDDSSLEKNTKEEKKDVSIEKQDKNVKPVALKKKKLARTYNKTNSNLKALFESANKK